MSPHRHERSDAELAALADAALAGDRSAANDLVRELDIRIGRYCRGKVGRSRGTFASADDVAQEALIAIYKALDTYRDTGSRFLPFAFGIAKNKVADYHRKNGREQHAQLDDAPDVADHRPNPEGLALHSERIAQIRALLDTLTERQREIVHMRVIVGYSAETTAERMDMTAGAVRVTQHRAMRNLRAQIRNNRKE